MCKLKTVLITNIVIFSVVLLLHLTRAISQWNLTSGPLDFPVWFSYIVTIFLAYMIYINWRNLK